MPAHAMLFRLAAVVTFLVAAWQMTSRWALMGVPTPLASDWTWRALLNAALFLLFAAHHSVWPRDWCRLRVVALIGRPLERPAYAMIASGLLYVVASLWSPLGGGCYNWPSGWTALARLAQAVGLIVAASALSHTDGLALIGWHTPRSAGPVSEAGPYRFVRHPLYAGLLVALGFVPDMTPDRAWLVTLVVTYVLVAIPLEEASLCRTLGDDYVSYCARVRSRLLPGVY